MWLLVAAAVLYVLYRTLIKYRPSAEALIKVKAGPSTLQVLATGAMRALGKQSGHLSGPVPGLKLVQDVKLEPEQLARYERATVFAKGRASEAAEAAPSHLSVCYPQVMSVRLAPMLLIDQGFPLSPMGIIHLRQRMTQFAPLPAGGEYRVEVCFARYASGLMYEESSKGIELNIRVLLTDRRSGQLLWEGDTYVVSRGAPSRRVGAPPVFESPVWDVQSQHAIDARNGLRYAAASGDYNPHHLYWFTALPMGFARPIAHGMWTLSAALHEVEALGVTSLRRYPLTVSCDFKKPLLMPATVTFGYRKGNDGAIEFGVYDKNNVNPHLMGTIQ